MSVSPSAVVQCRALAIAVVRAGLAADWLTLWFGFGRGLLGHCSDPFVGIWNHRTNPREVRISANAHRSAELERAGALDPHADCGGRDLPFRLDFRSGLAEDVVGTRPDPDIVRYFAALWHVFLRTLDHLRRLGRRGFSLPSPRWGLR